MKKATPTPLAAMALLPGPAYLLAGMRVEVWGRWYGTLIGTVHDGHRWPVAVLVRVGGKHPPAKIVRCPINELTLWIDPEIGRSMN